MSLSSWAHLIAFLASSKPPAQKRTGFAQGLKYGHHWETERRFEGRKCWSEKSQSGDRGPPMMCCVDSSLLFVSVSSTTKSEAEDSQYTLQLLPGTAYKITP